MLRIVTNINVENDILSNGFQRAVTEFSDYKKGTIIFYTEKRGVYEIPYSELESMYEQVITYSSEEDTLRINANEIKLSMNNKDLITNIKVFVNNATILKDFLIEHGHKVNFI